MSFSLSGSWVALVTPFTKENQIDIPTLKELIQWHIASPTDGIVCLGTTGESPTLSWEEKQVVIKTCIDTAQGKIPIMVGTGLNDTAKTVELTQMAKDLGAQAALVIVPYYNRPSEKGCWIHFEKVAEVGLPVILYHHPKRTGVSLSIWGIDYLYQQGYIQGIKEASGNLSWDEKLLHTSSIPFFSGEDSLTFPLLQKGAKGSISVIANLFPAYWKQLHDLCLQKNLAAAQNLLETLNPLLDALSLEVNPQGVKYALKLLGKCESSLRLPLIEPEPITQKAIEAALKNIFSSLSCLI